MVINVGARARRELASASGHGVRTVFKGATKKNCRPPRFRRRQSTICLRRVRGSTLRAPFPPSFIPCYSVARTCLREECWPEIAQDRCSRHLGRQDAGIPESRESGAAQRAMAGVPRPCFRLSWIFPFASLKLLTRSRVSWVCSNIIVDGCVDGRYPKTRKQGCNRYTTPRQL